MISAEDAKGQCKKAKEKYKTLASQEGTACEDIEKKLKGVHAKSEKEARNLCDRLKAMRDEKGEWKKYRRPVAEVKDYPKREIMLGPACDDMEALIKKFWGS